MITIIYNGPNKYVAEATQKSNELLKDENFFKKIAAHSSFDLSTATPIELAEVIKNSDFKMTIEFYKPRNPFSKAFAYDDPKNPLVVHLNSRRLNRSVASICATIIHECVHAAEAMQNRFEFGHGGNSSVGKENTAPYWIDKLAYVITSEGQTANVVFQHDFINNDIA